MFNATPVTPIDPQVPHKPDEAAILEALERFGHSSFRPGQREALDTLFEDGHLLLVAHSKHRGSARRTWLQPSTRAKSRGA